MAKKFKLDPDKYKEILNSIELISVSLVEGNWKLDYNEYKEDEKIINLFDKSSFKINKGNFITISHEYSVDRKRKENDTSDLKINAKYLVLLEGNVKFNEDFFEIYKEVGLNSFLWPYFREFVNDLTSRMNIEKIVLPFLRGS